MQLFSFKKALKVSDIFVSGSEWGKVKALIDDKGNNLKEAIPSSPVEVLGFDSNPLAGDDFIVVESERLLGKLLNIDLINNKYKKIK